MNAHEAALLAWQLGVQTVIPMHHYLWASTGANDSEATLDPHLLETTYQRLGGSGQVIIPKVGEEILLSPKSKTSQG